MNNFIIETDAVTKYASLSKEVKKALIKGRRKGMAKAASKIKSKTKSLIKSSFPAANKTSSNGSDKLIDGVRTIKYKYSEVIGEATTGVHILGTRKKNSQTYKLRFFEGGTGQRYIGKHKRTSKNGLSYNVSGHKVGKISGKVFFAQAISSESGKAPTYIEESIKKALENIK